MMSSLSGLICLMLTLGACSSEPSFLQPPDFADRDRPVTPDQWYPYQDHGSERIPIPDPRIPEGERPEVADWWDTPKEAEVEVVKVAPQVMTIEQVMASLQDLQKRVTELEYENRKLKSKEDKNEERTKVNNLIFTNVKESISESHGSTLRKVLHIVNNVMEAKVNSGDIAVAHRVDGDSATELRPILVTFNNFATKIRVLSKKYRLRGTAIEVKLDFSELVKQRRKELFPYLMMKRSHGHDAYIQYDKLSVDGVRMSLEELEAERRRIEARELEEIADENLREDTLLWESNVGNSHNEEDLNDEEKYDLPKEIDPCQDCEEEVTV